MNLVVRLPGVKALDPDILVLFAYLLTGGVVLVGVGWHETWHLEPWFAAAIVVLWPAFLVLVLAGRGLVLRGGDRPPPADQDLVGQSGVAVSDLRPTGKVEIAGRTREARADGYVPGGTRVMVVAAGPFGLRVRAELDDRAAGA